MSAATPSETASPRQPIRLIIFSAACVLLLASLSQTSIATAIPVIVADLGSVESVTWIMTVYLLASTVGAPISGKLADLYGSKPVLQACILVFLAGAGIGGLASSMGVLIFGRFIQGLGGGGLIVVAMTVVADVLRERDRGKAQGVVGAVLGFSTVFGPLLGGFLTEQFSWHWVLFINLPFGVLAFTGITFLLPKGGNHGRQKIDYPGAILLAITLTGIVLFASLGGTAIPWASWPSVALGVVCGLGFLGFLFIESRTIQPILPLGLFRINNFVVSNAVRFIIGMSMFGMITFIPLYLQVVKGYSPTVSGLLLLPLMFGFVGGSILSGIFMSRTGRYRIVPILSMPLLAVGALLLATITPDTNVWILGLYLLTVGIWIGPVNSIGVAAIQNAVPAGALGVATASSQMFRMIGGSVGVSIFGAIFAAGLSSRLPGGLLDDTGNTGLRAMSPQLISELPPSLRDTVLDAFTGALHPIFLCTAVAAVLAFCLSIILKEIPLPVDRRRDPDAYNGNVK
tara:strand:+ start:115 stop:1656 length:1542 start_codon:yes stop_codon:yes gene_type:complete|eukprot:jgi/Tetstr1/450970/TSEL_038006.t1